MDFGGGGVERRQWGMVVGFGGFGSGGDMDSDNQGICAKAAGKNCRVSHREANIRAVYRRVEDGGIQQVFRWWDQEHGSTQVEMEVG